MTKRKEFIYRGLGFPVSLVNVKTNKILGEERPVLNHAELEKQVFEVLLWADFRLSGAQLAFARTFMGLTQQGLSRSLGLKGHGRISQWEKSADDASGMTSATELGMRMIMAAYLNKTKEYSIHFERVLRGDLAEPEVVRVA